MSAYLNVDLSKVKTSDRPSGSSLLDRGTHEVMIESAAIKKTSKGGDQIEINYKNDNGSRKHWIMVNNPHSEENTRYGLQELKGVLDVLGWTGSNPPEVDWFAGKACEIEVWPDKNSGNLKVGRVNKSKIASLDAGASDFNQAPSADLDDEIPF